MGKESKIGMMIEAETKDLSAIYEKLVKTAGYELEKGIEQVDTQEMKEVADMIKDFSEAKKNIVKACYYVYILEAMEKEEEEGGEDEEMDDERRGYKGQPRSQSGRFMSRGDGRRSNRGRGGRRGYEPDMMMYDEDLEEMERLRDMDRNIGRMGYSGSGSSGGSSSGGMSGGNRGGSSGGSSGGGGSRGYEESGGQMSSRMQRDNESRYDRARRGYEETKSMGNNTPESKQSKMKELENYMKTMAEDLTEVIEGASPEERSLAKQKLSMLVQKM